MKEASSGSLPGVNNSDQPGGLHLVAWLVAAWAGKVQAASYGGSNAAKCWHHVAYQVAALAK